MSRTMDLKDDDAVSDERVSTSSGKASGTTTPVMGKEQGSVNYVTAKSPEPAAGPPNGGVQAWLQVLSAFFMFFNSWGLVNTFGQSRFVVLRPVQQRH